RPGDDDPPGCGENLRRIHDVPSDALELVTLASAVSMIVRPDAPTRPGPLRPPAAARVAARFALGLVGLGTRAGWAVSPAGAQPAPCAKHGCHVAAAAHEPV